MKGSTKVQTLHCFDMYSCWFDPWGFHTSGAGKDVRTAALPRPEIGPRARPSVHQALDANAAPQIPWLALRGTRKPPVCDPELSLLTGYGHGRSVLKVSIRKGGSLSKNADIRGSCPWHGAAWDYQTNSEAWTYAVLTNVYQ